MSVVYRTSPHRSKARAKNDQEKVSTATNRIDDIALDAIYQTLDSPLGSCDAPPGLRDGVIMYEYQKVHHLLIAIIILLLTQHAG